MMPQLYADLLVRIDKKLLEVKNKMPVFESVCHITGDPCIEYIALTLGYSPEHFARKILNGYSYDIEKLNDAKIKVLYKRAEKLAVFNLRQYAS